MSEPGAPAGPRHGDRPHPGRGGDDGKAGGRPVNPREGGWRQGKQAAGDAAHRRDAGLPRAELLELRAGHQADRRPGRARGVPDQHDPRLHRAAARTAPRASASTPAPRGGPAASRGGCATGTWVGHVAEHVALQLQRDAGTEVGRGKTRSTGEPGRYHVVFSYAEESVGIAAGQAGRATRQPPGRSRSRASTSRPSSSSSCCSPSGRRSAPPPRRSSTRPACATSPGSASTRRHSCSWATASTRSGFGPR